MDEFVRTRLDRPFTREEAKERDVVNREKLEKGRTGRVDPYLSGTEMQARAKRNKLSQVSELLGSRMAAEARRARASASL